MFMKHLVSRQAQMDLLCQACEAHEAARVRLFDGNAGDDSTWYDTTLVALQCDGVVLKFASDLAAMPAGLDQSTLEIRFGHQGVSYAFVAAASGRGNWPASNAEAAALKVGLPAGVHRRERRREPRINLTLSDAVTVRLETLGDCPTEIHGWVMNLSRGGMAVRVQGAPKMPVLGTLVAADLKLPGEERPVHLFMKVKRVNPLCDGTELAVACMVVPGDDDGLYQRQFVCIERFIEKHKAHEMAAVAAPRAFGDTRGG